MTAVNVRSRGIGLREQVIAGEKVSGDKSRTRRHVKGRPHSKDPVPTGVWGHSIGLSQAHALEDRHDLQVLWFDMMGDGTETDGPIAVVNVGDFHELYFPRGKLKDAILNLCAPQRLRSLYSRLRSMQLLLVLRGFDDPNFATIALEFDAFKTELHCDGSLFP